MDSRRRLVAAVKWTGTAGALAVLVACTLNAALGWHWFGQDDALMVRIGWLPFAAALRWVVMPWAEQRVGERAMSFNQKRLILAGPALLCLLCLADGQFAWGLFGRYGAVVTVFSLLTVAVLFICLPITPEEMRQHRER